MPRGCPGDGVPGGGAPRVSGTHRGIQYPDPGTRRVRYPGYHVPGMRGIQADAQGSHNTIFIQVKILCKMTAQLQLQQIVKRLFLNSRISIKNVLRLLFH